MREIAEFEKELETIQKNATKKKLGYMDAIKQKPLRRALIVALLMQIAQQLIGADAVTICLHYKL